MYTTHWQIYGEWWLILHCWPQFRYLFTNFFPISLIERYFETLTSWGVLWLKLLPSVPWQWNLFQCHLALFLLQSCNCKMISKLTRTAQSFYTCYTVWLDVNYSVVPCSAPVWKYLYSPCFYPYLSSFFLYYVTNLYIVIDILILYISLACTQPLTLICMICIDHAVSLHKDHYSMNTEF